MRLYSEPILLRIREVVQEAIPMKEECVIHEVCREDNDQISFKPFDNKSTFRKKFHHNSSQDNWKTIFLHKRKTT